MINKPYVRQINANGEVINFPKEGYLHKFKKQPKKNADIYLILTNGQKVKNFGNNRANHSKRKGKSSRLHARFMK